MAVRNQTPSPRASTLEVPRLPSFERETEALRNENAHLSEELQLLRAKVSDETNYNPERSQVTIALKAEVDNLQLQLQV